MKLTRCIFLLFTLCVSHLPVQSQDWEKMAKSDSLCKWEENNPSKKIHSFVVPDSTEGYLPYEKSYVVYSRNNIITSINCRYLMVFEENPYEYGYLVDFTVCLTNGSVLGFYHSEDMVEFDTTITDQPKRINNYRTILPWSLSETWLDGELIWYMSNGHGITETDAFSPEGHCNSTLQELKEDIKKKYPVLK